MGLSDILRKVNETSTAQSFSFIWIFIILARRWPVAGDESLNPLQSSNGLLSLRIVL
jgi:hypothetical protein